MWAARIRGRAPWTLLAIGVALAVGFGGFAARPDAPGPTELSASILEDRLHRWDPGGAGAPFHIRGYLDDGAPSDTPQWLWTAAPRARQTEVDWGSSSSHRYGNLIRNERQDEVLLYRDYLPMLLPNISAMQLLARNSTGGFDGLVGEEPLRVLVDAEARIRTVAYANGAGRLLRWEFQYDNLTFNRFDFNGFRMPVNIPWYHGTQKPGVRYTVNISDFGFGARLGELELRYSQRGSIVRTAPFNRTLDEAGFHFAYLDRDHNGIASRGDAYEFEVPPNYIEARVFDRWANALVDDYANPPAKGLPFSRVGPT